MTEAIVAFVGVIVGGLISAAAQWQVERRRERKDAEVRFRQARTARRLVGDEIDTLAVALGTFASYGRRPDDFDADYSFPNAEWEKHKETLAASIDDDELWRWLATFYLNMKGFRHMFTKWARAQKELSEDDVQALIQREGEAQEILFRLREIDGLPRSMALPGGGELHVEKRSAHRRRCSGDGAGGNRGQVLQSSIRVATQDLGSWGQVLQSHIACCNARPNPAGLWSRKT